MKRLHITVSDEMHKCIKLFATFHGLTANGIANKALINYLKSELNQDNPAFLKEQLNDLLNKEDTT